MIIQKQVVCSNRRKVAFATKQATFKEYSKKSSPKEIKYYHKNEYLEKKEVKAHFKNLFRLGEVNRLERDIMLAFISFWGEQGIFPNYETIAVEVLCSLSSVKNCAKKMKRLGVLDWENRHLKKQQFSNKYFFTISEEEFEKVKEKAAEVKAEQEGAKKGKSPEKKGFLQHFRALKQSVKITLTRNNYNKYNYKNKVFKQSTDPVFISMENSVDSFQKSRLTLCDLVSRKYQALLKKSKEQAQIFLKATFSLNIHADTDKNCSEIDLKRVRSELARLGVC